MLFVQGGVGNLPHLHDGLRGDPESPRLTQIPSGHIPGDLKSPFGALTDMGTSNLLELHELCLDIYTWGTLIS